MKIFKKINKFQLKSAKMTAWSHGHESPAKSHNNLFSHNPASCLVAQKSLKIREPNPERSLELEQVTHVPMDQPHTQKHTHTVSPLDVRLAQWRGDPVLWGRQ
jgi:hypothetical protein